MSRILTAFFSRAGENYFKGSYKMISVGNTQKAAQTIASLTGADLYKIEETEPYSDNYQTCITQAKKDLTENKRPALKNPMPDMSKYDEIYLCYPNYWGTMPMAVYTFLESADFKDKKIHPLCTHEGSGLSSTPKDIEKTVPGAVVLKGLAVHGSDVDSSENIIKKWICESK